MRTETSDSRARVPGARGTRNFNEWDRETVSPRDSVATFAKAISRSLSLDIRGRACFTRSVANSYIEVVGEIARGVARRRVRAILSPRPQATSTRASTSRDTDGRNYGRATLQRWRRWRRRQRRAPATGGVFITKSKTDSSPFPVRPACLAEHNIS